MTRKYNPKSKANLKPFKPDNPETGEKDERINRKGRARSFDELRELFQEIANQDVNGKSKIQALGERMMQDRKLMRTFLEFAYGKVPLKIDGELLGEIKFTHVYDDEPRLTNPSSKELPSETDGSNTKSSKEKGNRSG